MRQIFFLLPDYPNWLDGGLKYQTIVFNYFKSKYEKVYAFGKSVELKKSKNKFFELFFKIMHVLRIGAALVHVSRIPRHSVIVLNNAFFLDYSLPVTLNKLWKKHVYFMVIHHLVQKDRPNYLRMKLENYFISRADKLITVSKTSHNEIINLSVTNKEIPIIVPGLDVDFSEIPAVKKFPGKTKILFVGSIDKRKGLIYLIESLAGLNINNFELNCIGRITHDFNYELLLNKVDKLGLKNNVFFRGRLQGSELKNYYNDSTVFVFPSLWEGYGMAVAEAMAYGLPVVASRLPALEELVDDGINGYLVEPGNSAQITKVLNTLLNNNELLEKFSQNAVSKAKTFPGWGSSSEKIWQIVQEFL